MNQIDDFRKKFNWAPAWVIFAAIAISSCDTLQKDSVQNQDAVTLVNKEIYITPQSSGIIDLKTMVQTYGTYKLSVSGQPRNGTLKTLGQDLLKYTPKAGFTSGADGFGVSVYTTSSEFVKTDSVKIIIKKDSVGMPCGLWAMNDTRVDVKAAIDIDVLSNDILCGVDKNVLEVTISANAQPASGTVQVLSDKKIRYTPGANFTGTDQFAYRLLKPENVPNQGDKLLSSYGLVTFASTASCKDSLRVNNDNFKFTFAGLNLADTIRVRPTNNDVICRRESNVFAITILQAPAGKLFVTQYPPYEFKYLAPSSATAGFIDNFKYQICVDEVCKTGDVKIELN